MAAQPWCDGAVGMAGRSYAGAAQWLAAAEQPPHLRAICPVVIGSDFYDGWIYQGGAFQLGFNLFWALLIGAPKEAPRATSTTGTCRSATPPLLEDPGSGRLLLRVAGALHQRRLLAAGWPSAAATAGRRCPATTSAAGTTSSCGGTLRELRAPARGGRHRGARRAQSCWSARGRHGSTYGPYPDQSFRVFAPDDAIDLDRAPAALLRALTCRDDRTASTRSRRCGSSSWARTAGATRTTGRSRAPRHALVPKRRGRRAAPALAEPPGRRGAGRLRLRPGRPRADGRRAHLAARAAFGDQRRPARPAARRGAARRARLHLGAAGTPLEVTGPLRLVLWAATSAPDTDWVAKLMRRRRRAATRASWPRASCAPASATATSARAGGARRRVRVPHRPRGDQQRVPARATGIRVGVTSSSFPRFDRNPNTGQPLGADGPDDLRPARQTIFHDRERPSHIVLPVIPR